MTTAKKMILIVDDDPDVILQLTTILQQDYVVHSAASASEAEEMLMNLHPDLAIIDLMMEQKDSGFVLCHIIRKLHPGIPVMMLTAVKATTGLSFATDSDDAQSWLKADVMVDKPVRPEQLKAVVRKLIECPPVTENERE